MFEVPSAKRVKRSEAFDSHDAVKTNSDADQAVNSSYGFDYDFVTPSSESTRPNFGSAPAAAAQQESFSFRLFSSTSGPSTFTVRPQTPLSEIALSEGRFLRPSRPDSYYFTSAADPSSLAQYQHHLALSATNSDEIRKLSTAPWPGMEMAWRVLHLRSPVSRKTRQSSNLFSAPPIGEEASAERRSKPNKKRRITLRQRLVARQQTQLSAVDREKTEREKRNLRNREKKIKRRARERQKKAEAKLVEGDEQREADGKNDYLDNKDARSEDSE